MCLMQVKVYLVQVFLESSCKRKFLSTFKLFFSEHLRASNKNARIILWSFYLANLNFFHPLLPLQFTFYPWLIVWVGYRWPSKNTLSIGSLKADVAIKNPSSQVNDISTGAFVGLIKIPQHHWILKRITFSSEIQPRKINETKFKSCKYRNEYLLLNARAPILKIIFWRQS